MVLKLYVSGPSPAALKCLAVAAQASQDLEVVKAEASELPSGVTFALSVDGTLLHDSNAAMGYLAYQKKTRGKKVFLEADSLAVENKLQIESQSLCPQVEAAVAAKRSSKLKFPLTPTDLNTPLFDASVASASANVFTTEAGVKGAAATASSSDYAPFQELARAINNIAKYVDTAAKTPDLADVAIAATLYFVFTAGIFEASAFPELRAWAVAMYEDAGFKAAIEQLPSLKQYEPVEAPKPTMEQLRAPIGKTLEGMFIAACYAAFPCLKDLDAFKENEVVVPRNTSKKFTYHFSCASGLRCFDILRKAAGLGSQKKDKKGKGKKGETKEAEKPQKAVIDPAIVPQSPAATSEALVAAMPLNPIIEKMEVTKIGSIGIWISASFLSERTALLVKEGPSNKAPKSRRVCVDYSSPNIAKDMHVGHLRSTILGDCLSRVLEFCGHTVVRVNHVGDWGTQFGMLIAHLKDLSANLDTSEIDITDLTKFYKEAKKRFDDDKEFNVRAHHEVVALQAGDETNLKLWRRLVEISENMFNSVYNRLGIDSRLEVVGESFYNDKVGAIVQELEKNKVVEISDGATIVRIPGKEVPLMVKKKDGGIGYDSTDLAALKYRLEVLNCDWLVYVVDAGQSLHFELVFKAAERAGWVKPEHRIEHVGFGVVLGEDKKKFKTRSGETVRLVDLLDEANKRATEVIRARAAKGDTKVDEADVERAGQAIGVGGIKYYDLKNNRTTDYVFSFDRMLDQNGDTAVYMEYAHARICQVLRVVAERGGAHVADLVGNAEKEISLHHASELSLAIDLAEYGDALDKVLAGMQPHHLTTYMFRLANSFSDFYRDCRVAGDDKERSRVLLCDAVRQIIASGLRLLGIEPLNRI